MNFDLQYAEAFATSAGFMQALLAALLWRHHHLQPRWGMRWLALSMAGSALINLSAHYLITPFLVPGTLLRTPQPVAIFLFLTGFACLAALIVGIRAYTGRQRWRSRYEFLLLWPLLLVFMLVSVGRIPLAGDLTSVAVFLYCAWQVAQAARSERRAGHSLLCAVLCIQPVTLLLLLASGMAVALARYFSALPFALIGVALLSISLHRLRHSLTRELAARLSAESALREQQQQMLTVLESEVQRRTAQLQAAQQELRVSDQRLRAVLATTGEGIWDWDILQGSMFNNARWCEIFGYPAQEGQHPVQMFSEHLHPDDRSRVQSALARSLSDDQPFSHEHRMLKRDGSLLWVHDRGAVTERDADGRALRMIGSMADITERKLASLALAQAKLKAETSAQELQQALDHLKQTQEQLLQAEKLAALGGLVAGVAHELNTPIGNTLTTASTLLDQVRELQNASASNSLRKSQLNDFLGNSREAAELIQRNADRASQLIASFKQVAVDQTSMLRRRFKLASVVSDALAMVALNLKRLPIRIEIDVPEQIELDSFPGSLEQILTNLLQNAAIYGLLGREALLISVSACPAPRQENSHVLLVFADDGAGMSAETAQRAFDPFFTTRFGQGGSGLGLYIVYSLVHGALGGSITLDSAPGGGTRFSLLLPLQAPASPNTGEAATARSVAAAPH